MPTKFTSISFIQSALADFSLSAPQTSGLGVSPTSIGGISLALRRIPLCLLFLLRYEHNQGKVKERSWAQLRAISDELCKEHGISVIEPKAKGVSHFEHDMQLHGKSWKDKLRAKIAEVAFYSKDFADFLRNCSASGIEYVYKPQNKVKLKFRLSDEGQQKFTRADTLGEDYTAERIAEQIEQIQKAKSAMERLAEKKKPEKAFAPSKPAVTPKTEPTATVITPTKPTEHGHLISDLIRSKMQERGISQAPAPKPTTVADEPESNLSVMTEEEYITEQTSA